jgi:tetratricopeptide (TPR) repeat protein
MTLEVRNLLQVANELYVQKREEEAIPYLYEVIRLSPRVEHAWLLLALIKESQGNHERAFIFRYCAAQNTRNPDLWVMLARELR